jgi:hypothetical protein
MGPWVDAPAVNLVETIKSLPATFGRLIFEEALFGTGVELIELL